MDFPVGAVTLLAFAPAAFALNLTPGADMMFCLGQGLRSGPKAAMAANLGIAVGGMVHTTVAGLGLGALLAAHPWSFEVIRWVGVAYLLWLAFAAIRGSAQSVVSEAPTAGPGRVFLDALMVNLLNPKVILFILAFLPQFVDPGKAVLPQFLILGLVFCAGGLLVNGVVGGFAGSVGRAFAGSNRAGRVLGYASAAIFSALALRLAVLQRG